MVDLFTIIGVFFTIVSGVISVLSYRKKQDSNEDINSQSENNSTILEVTKVVLPTVATYHVIDKISEVLKEESFYKNPLAQTEDNPICDSLATINNNLLCDEGEDLVTNETKHDEIVEESLFSEEFLSQTANETISNSTENIASDLLFSEIDNSIVEEALNEGVINTIIDSI